MCPLVGLEVGTLGVHLITVHKVTLVDLATFERVRGVGFDHLRDGGHRT